MCEREGQPEELGRGAGLGDLEAAARRFAGRGGADSPEALREELIGLRRVIDLLEIEFSASAVRLDALGPEEWEGRDAASHWIRDHCRMTAIGAYDALAVGTHAPSLPRSIQALEGGDIGFAHLRQIARTADWLGRPGTEVSLDEEFLLRRARGGGTVAELQRACAHLRHAGDPRRFLHEQVDQVEARFLQLTATEGGGTWLRGYLDSEGGAALRTALEPLARRHGEEDARSAERRRADALVELCGRALDSGSLPRQGGQRPHLQVTVSLETLTGDGGAPAAELERGGAIPAETALRLGCSAAVSRVVFGPGSQVVDVGRATRVPQAATRRALRARDAGCVWPGCGQPSSVCEPHHITHWARGGETSLANLASLCRRHHFLVHEGRWRLIRAGDRFRALAPVPRDLPPPRVRAPVPPAA
jgi:hypothetical protein